MLGNHPFAWFITFAFFCEVFKEHKLPFKTFVLYGRLVNILMLTSYCMLTQELTTHYVRNNYIIISAKLLQQVCFGIPSKLNNVSAVNNQM